MRLKLIVSVNFQRTEAANLQAVLKAHPELELGSNDVVLMVSLDKSQMVFMYRRQEIDLTQYGKRQGVADVYHSERVRLSRSTWDHRMLQDYAQQARIELDGFRKFEEIYASLREPENVINVKAKKRSAKILPLRRAA